MHLTDLKFSKNRCDHDPTKGLEELLTLPDIDSADTRMGALIDPYAGANHIEPDDWWPEQFPVPSLDSAQIHREAAVLAWMARVRDVPFSSFDADAMVDEARHELADKFGVTNPFRPDHINMGGGHYVSHLLTDDVPMGDPSGEATKRRVHNYKGQSYGISLGEACRMQSGQPLHQLKPTTSAMHPLGHSPRTLTTIVKSDHPNQHCIDAALILNSLPGVITQTPAHDPEREPMNAAFVDWNLAHLIDVMSTGLHRALQQVWHWKWTLEYARPELWFIAAEMRRKEIGEWGPQSGVDSAWLSSQFNRMNVDDHGTILLPLAYCDGSPPHPSAPPGHAIVAAYCGTILKLWYRDGQWPATGAASVHEEINKMVFNTTYARSWAGVHWLWENDAGMAMGERLAKQDWFNLVNSVAVTGQMKEARFRPLFSKDEVILVDAA